MAYMTGNLTSATPATALYDVIASHLAAVGWTLEDTVVITTITHKVWKNPAANNGSGNDFFIDLSYATAGTGSVFASLFELYDAATDTFQRPAPGAGSNKTPHATGYYVQDAAAALNAGSRKVQSLNTTTSVAFAYFVSATTDRLCVGTRTTVDTGFYAGLYECEMGNPMPLCFGALEDDSDMATTREPFQTAASTNNFLARINSGLDWTAIQLTSNELYGGRPVAIRCRLYSARTSVGLHGLLIGVVCIPLAHINGDTVTDVPTGDVYVRMGDTTTSNAGYYVDTEV